MQGYFKRLLAVILAGVAVTLLMWLVNSGRLNRDTGVSTDSIHVLEQAENTLSEEEIRNIRKKVLILRTEDDISEKLSGNLQKVCDWMKLDNEAVDVSRKDSVSYMEYDIIIIATMDVEDGIGKDLERIMDYVAGGGRLFWAVMPEEIGSSFLSVYRQLGISDLGSFTTIEGISFRDELLPGSRNLSFAGEEFSDSAIALRVDDNCRIYVEAADSGLPVVWTKDYGAGRLVFYNAAASRGDYLTGMLGGCIASLYDQFMYPVINAKVIFIDDFPSPQYNSDSDVIKQEYNRTVKEFYRDIWWPDMQSAAKKYHLSYTGLFMATYNDIVNPENFEYSKDNMEQYFGDSLVKNGYEMGAHGYNHQSLTLAGGTPKELHYVPWDSQEDMAASIRKLAEITKEMFPGVTLMSYVPPSNYLSAEGRAAVAEALPALKVISGVYTSEGSEGEVYVQSFGIAEDGIAEFPRLTSGMLKSDYEDFITINGCGLYGVYSHFIHPDDILDPDRSLGQTWQQMLDIFCERVNMVNKRYEGLRPLTASDAADALKIADAAEVSLEISEDRIEGICYNYYGEVTFFLRSEKRPLAASDGCKITPLTNLYNTDYYSVTISEPAFTIKLGG